MRAREAFGFQLPLLELHCHWARTWEAGLNFWKVNIGPLSLPPCHWLALPVDEELGEVPLDGVDEEAGLGGLEKGKEGVGAGTIDLHLDISTTCRWWFDLLSMKIPILEWIFEILWIPSPWNTRTRHTSPWPRSPPPGRCLVPDLQTGRKEELRRFVENNPHSHPHHPNHIRHDQLHGLQGKMSKRRPQTSLSSLTPSSTRSPSTLYLCRHDDDQDHLVARKGKDDEALGGGSLLQLHQLPIRAVRQTSPVEGAAVIRLNRV